MHQQIVDARNRQIELQALPVLTIIERQVNTMAGAGVQQPRQGGILAHHVDELTLRQAVTDFTPARAGVVGDISAWREIIQPVPVDGHIGGIRVSRRRIDEIDPAPVLQAGGRDIVPSGTAIGGQMHPSIVASDPNQLRPAVAKAQWQIRCRNHRPCPGDRHIAVAIRGSRICPRQVRTDGLPALTAIE